MSKEQILVVDDDPQILRLVRANLERSGYVVLTATNGSEALDVLVTELPDMIILDLMLPDMSGYEVCNRIRDFSLAPVIMLTAKGEQVDKLKGFEVGADDYLTKPFAPLELLARVGAILRRAQQGPASTAPATVICGDMTIDLARRRVTRSGERVNLTKTEYELLQQLALNMGKVLSHEDLLTKVWGPEYRDDRDYLWAYVRYLRRKLEPDPKNPTHIISEPGFGYFLECHSGEE